MAVLIRPKGASRSLGSALRTGDPLATGLAALVRPTGGSNNSSIVDALSGITGSGSVGTVQGASGKLAAPATRFTGVSQVQIVEALPASLAAATAVTVLAVWQWDGIIESTTNGNSTALAVGNATTGAWGLQANHDGSGMSSYLYTGGTYNGVGGNVPLLDGLPALYAFRYQSGNLFDIWAIPVGGAGIAHVASSAPPTGAVGAGGANVLTVANNPNALGNHLSGLFYVGGVWERVLSVGELLRIAANPYTFFAPQAPSQRYWIKPSGGTLSKTAALTATATLTATPTLILNRTSTLTAKAALAAGTPSLVLPRTAALTAHAALTATATLVGGVTATPGTIALTDAPWTTLTVTDRPWWTVTLTDSL